MSRQKWMMGTILLSVLFLFACGGPQQEQAAEDSDDGAGLLTADPMKYAVNLWKSDITWYGTWNLLPGTKKMELSRGNPHGMYGSDYGNSLANSAAKGNAERMPEGSIIVRENYNKDKETIRITAMRKTNGEWFWVVYNPDGTVELAGKLDTCIECHKESARDMLFFWIENHDQTE